MTGVELATAYISIVPEGSRIAPEVRRQFGQVGPEATRAGKAAGKNFSSGFGGSVKALALGSAGLAVGKFFKDAISGASDLNESSTKITAIFGSAQGAVQEFASGGAKALGQTKLQVLDAAATFGTFGKAAGLAGPGLAKFSTGFAGLSTDLASFFNTDPSQAVEAIGAALRGEAEPIRQYGVLLDDATLRNEALRLGLIKTTKTALTPQQKVLAAQAAIYKQTKDAQGDFQRTSAGLANQQRILKAQFSDLRSELGTKLLPVAAKVVSKTSELVTEFQKGTGTGGEIRDVLEDVASAGKAVFKFFDSIPGPVKKFGAEAAIALVVLSKFRSITGPATTSLGAFTTGLRNAETRMTTVTTASQKLGAGLRNAAGAGGLLLIANGAQQANAKLGLLMTTAGGLAAGFAVGGPVGAAVGGLAAVTYTLFQSTKSAGDESKVQIGSWKQYAETLNGVSAATTKATREMVFQRLESSGLIKATRELGLTDRQAISAILTNGPARQKLNNLLAESARKSQDLAFAQKGVVRSGSELTAGQILSAAAAGRYNTITKAQRQALAAETGAIQASRRAQLEKNVALASSTAELKKAQAALHALMAEPSDKKVKLTISTFTNFFSSTKPKAPTATEQLLDPTKRARGGPVRAGQPYIVGERRPELFVPNQGGRIQPKVPTVASSVVGTGGGQIAMTITNWQTGQGYFEFVADGRVAAQRSLDGMNERAFG